MDDWRSQSHVRWDCRYHVVIVPEHRERRLYGQTRKWTGEVLRDSCRQRGVTVFEGRLCADHVHMCLSIPPECSVAFVIASLKGKSAIRIHRKASGMRG